MLNRRALLGRAGLAGLAGVLLPSAFMRAAGAAGADAGEAGATVIPTPESVLGFKVGADFHLASYQQALTYFRALAAATPMIRLLEIGKTSLGKPMICAIISSAENMQRLDRFREISEKLTLAEGLTDDEARRLAAEGRAVVYIDGGLHSNEVAPAQHNLQLAYDLVTSTDADTRLILDNTILLLNFANPDGMDIVAKWYGGNVGTPYELSPMPILWHAYAGHDNNRDAYMLNLQETRAILRLQFRSWYPVMQINHHQTSPFPSRISFPPLPEPVNPNIHPLLTRWKSILGSMMGAAFDRNNQPGAISRIVIDGWAPDMFDSIGDLFHTMSTSPETALYEYATPHFYELEELPEDYRDFTPSIFYPNPWKGGWWRLKDAVDYILTCSKSALQTAAVFREQLLYDKYRMGRDVIERYRSEPPYAWIVPQGQWDPPVAALMLNRMLMTGVSIFQAQGSFQNGSRTYPAGTWVVPMQQPFAAYVKTLLEEQRYPDLARYPDLWQGIVQPQRFSDVYLAPFDASGWTLPYQMGVEVIAAKEPVQAELARIDEAAAPAGSVSGSAQAAFLVSSQLNNAFTAINRLLGAKAQVSRARTEFMAGEQRFAPGTWIVRSTRAARSAMESLAKDLSLPVHGVDRLPEVDTLTIGKPKVALYQSWIASMDEGWTRWLFEQYEFAYSTVHDADIRAGRLGSKFDVLVIPDNYSADLIVSGHEAGKMPPQFVGGIAEQGVKSIQQFVRGGGTLLLLNGSCNFAIDRLGVPVTDVLKDLRPPQPDAQDRLVPPAPVKFTCPGSILRMTFDPTHPVAYGMPANGAASFADSVAFDVDASASSQTSVIARYPSGDLLLSGSLTGGNYLNDKAAAVEVAVGKGRVILLGFGAQRRAQPHQTFKLLFNSIFYSTARQSRFT